MMDADDYSSTAHGYQNGSTAPSDRVVDLLLVSLGLVVVAMGISIIVGNLFATMLVGVVGVSLVGHALFIVGPSVVSDK